MSASPASVAASAGVGTITRRAIGGYTASDGLQRLVSVHQWLPRGVRSARGDLPLPHVRRPPRSPARHGGAAVALGGGVDAAVQGDRKSTRLNSSHSQISYAVFCLKKKKK